VFTPEQLFVDAIDQLGAIIENELWAKVGDGMKG
jgi:hypothetical protein